MGDPSFLDALGPSMQVSATPLTSVAAPIFEFLSMLRPLRHQLSVNSEKQTACQLVTRWKRETSLAR
jgi:hypothetical protein